MRFVTKVRVTLTRGVLERRDLAVSIRLSREDSHVEAERRPRDVSEIG